MKPSRPILAALAALFLLPATAHGAALVTLPCSASLPGQKSVPIQGSGFAPNSFVRLFADGQSYGGAQVDAAGTFADVFFAPSFRSLATTEQTFQLTADDGMGGLAPATPLRVTRVGAKLPSRSKPGRRVRMRVFGFAPERVVFLHVRRGGKTRGTFRIGRTASPCGTASRRLRYMPLRRYASGTYTYAFQQSRRFDRTKPRVQLRIVIFRTVRPR